MMNYFAESILILAILAASADAHSDFPVPSKPGRALSVRRIPKMDRDVTFLGFGGIEIGRDWAIGVGQDRQHPDQMTSIHTLKTAIDLGLRVFDTASAYHLSEERIGFLTSMLSSDTLVNTKCGEHSILASNPQCKHPAYDQIYCNDPATYFDFSPKAIRESVERSLRRLNINKIDTLFLHFGPDAEKVLDKGDAVATLKALKREGKIRHIGASIDGALAKRCIQSGEFDAIELEYNLLNQSNEENIALAHASGMGVFIRGGLGTGLLTSRVQPYLQDSQLPFRMQILELLKLVDGNFEKLTALELAFLFQNKGISSVVVGTRNAGHVIENIRLLDQFREFDQVKRATKLMEKYPQTDFTYMIDAYFQKDR